uniref:Transposase n=1 Tax=Peronospora matthiolae TaxID=2874970 RepID=A0AAV1TQV6_9STRA
MGVTAHYIDKNWKLWNLVVAAVEIEGDHSDNASTSGTIAMCSEQRRIIPGFTRSDNMLGCMAHVINLIANAGIKLLGAFDQQPNQNIVEIINPMSVDALLLDRDIEIEKAGTIVRRVRDFTKYINGSPQRLQNFRKLADVVAADVTAKKLVQDVSTRWNSTWAMLNRAVLLRKVIGAYIDSGSELRKYALEEHEWALVHEVIKLLEPLEEATVLLSSAKYPSIMAAATV